MNAILYHTDESAEYFFKEGCHILEWLNTPEDPAVSVARARVDPGIRTRRHFLVWSHSKQCTKVPEPNARIAVASSDGSARTATARLKTTL